MLHALIAAERGFGSGGAYAAALLFTGLAVLVAVVVLSREEARPFSPALVYLGLGAAAAVVLDAAGIPWLNPLVHTEIIERATEFAVVVALFSTGLKLDRPLAWRTWSSVARLLGIAMPLTIAAVALLGVFLMGLPVAVAVLLGAALAPTDPVLAGDVGVGPPGEEEEEREANFSLTAEAGLNDGLAFPFVILGFFLADRDDLGWLPLWIGADLVYAVVVGLAIGAAAGYGLAALALRLRDRGILDPALDGWMALAAVLAIYGIAELANGYGFLAAFAGGVAFRRFERDHEYNRRVHGGSETVENLAELAVLLLLGTLLTLEGLGEPGWTGWLAVVLLIAVVRPASVLVASVRSRLAGRERAFVAWFGVRGIGSLYYVAFVLGAGVVAEADDARLFWTVAAAVIVSVVVHGLTSAPLGRRFTP